MTRVKLSSVLLGATALSLPLGMTAFAQQTQQNQQGQQAAAQQGTELGACERLLRLVEEAGEEQLLAEFEEAPKIGEQNEAESCALVIRQVEQAGGISEEAVAEGRGVQFRQAEGETDVQTDTESFMARDRVQQTVQIEQEAIVEGEVMVRQAIPEIGIEQGGPEVGVVPGRVDAEIQEQPAEITIRQAPATVRVQIPEPTITIEQPAPEIVLHMPPPGVSLEQQQPQVTVNIPDPNVTVSQAEPQVTAEVDARFVDEEELAQLEQSDQPRVTTVTERLDAAGNPVDEQKQAEVTIRKGEAQVSIQESQEQGEVRFQRAEPRIVFEQAEPNVEVAFAENARVEVQQTGEPTVRIERGDQQQAQAQGEQGQDATSAQAVGGGEGASQLQQRVQAAGEALEQQDVETARAEIDAANQDLALAMEQADEDQRQQMEALREQFDLVIVALDQEDLQGAQTALEDAEMNLAENHQLFATAQTPVAGQTGSQQTDAEMQRLSMEDTNRLLMAEEEASVGQAQLTNVQAGDLSGADVVTMRGEEVGEIDQIASSGDQLYAIIEHGGFLGIGEEQIAIPLERIAMRGDEVILLGLSEEQLAQMPEYDFESDQEFSATDEVEIGRFE